MGKGEKAGYQHFLLFSQCFQKASLLGVIKNRDCVVKSNVNKHIVGQDENACDQHSLLFLRCFQFLFVLGKHNKVFIQQRVKK